MRQHAADVRGHVVGSFRRVRVCGITVGRKFGHKCLKVTQHGRICILAEHQRCARVPNKYITQTRFDARLQNSRVHLVSQVIGTSPARFDSDLALRNHCAGMATYGSPILSRIVFVLPNHGIDTM